MDASRMGSIRPDCICDRGRRGRLLPSESDPCEWHFQFESLAESKHSDRIRALDIDFDGDEIPREERTGKAQLALGSCRFFTSSFPQLTTLGWRIGRAKHANHLFSTSLFIPTLRSLTYAGSWDDLAAPINNLTSFAYKGRELDGTDLESVRSFLLNNRALESLDLDCIDFEGRSVGPPVCLSNLKSLSVNLVDGELSAIIQVPALRHLSSLRIESDGIECYTLCATGDGITFSARHFPSELAEIWEGFTRHARPTVRHVHLDDSEAGAGFYGDDDDLTFVSLLLDAHTLEIGHSYFPFWYHEFLDDLKELGPQLETIRFGIPEDMEPFPEDDDEFHHWDDGLLDCIEDLVRYRFFQGRPLSTVERLVTSKSERTNREQEFVWRCFYNGRELCKYVQSG